MWGYPAFRGYLNGFIEDALQTNPILLEANHKINVFKETPPQVGSLDDPMLQLGLMNIPVDSFSFSRQAMTQKQLTVTQKFPYPGKLGLKVQAAMDRLIELNENKDIEMGKLNSLMDRLPQAPLNIPHGLRQTKLFLSVDKLQALASYKLKL